MKVAICIPSRNRPEALQECLYSCVLALNLSEESGNGQKFHIFVRDNSDDLGAIAKRILTTQPLQAYQNYISLAFNKYPLPMSMNWDALANDAAEAGYEYVIFLADRRLLTPEVIRLTSLVERLGTDVVVFDHQSWWLSASHLLRTRQYTQKGITMYTDRDRIRDLRHSVFDNLTPRLYNCIVKIDLLKKFSKKYECMVGGPFPDLSFQFRLAFESSVSCLITDYPVIACNARHASLTSSSSGVPNVTSQDPFHCIKCKSLFGFSDEFIFARCIAHLCELVGIDGVDDARLGMWFSQYSLMSMALWELVCPMHSSRFKLLKDNLISILSDPFSPVTSRLTYAQQVELNAKIHAALNKPVELQRQPLDFDMEPLMKDSYFRLANLYST